MEKLDDIGLLERNTKGTGNNNKKIRQIALY